MEWRIGRDVVADLERHSRDERPRECCGVLIGVPGRVTASRRVRNLAADANRFELDPQGHVAAIRDTRGTAVGVVGFYHSHPHSPPLPSPRDLAESTYPDALYIIAGVPDDATGDVIAIRAYHLRAAAYEDVALVVVDPDVDDDRTEPR